LVEPKFLWLVSAHDPYNRLTNPSFHLHANGAGTSQEQLFDNFMLRMTCKLNCSSFWVQGFNQKGQRKGTNAKGIQHEGHYENRPIS